MTELYLTNSKTRRKERFVPIDPADVRMYVCGPTVYDRAHLGNARPAVVFDILFRVLREVYGPDHVTYVRNITDVEDKINARAAESGRSIKDITDETSTWYLDDMAALGTLPPTHVPRATQYIPQMVTMIETLIDRGHAYEAEGHVLFDVRSYEHYGALSGRSVDDMIAGARVEVAPYKRDPMDFVLWKPSDAETPGWDSPWGRGRPGWHIECSAMSHELLGASFDIHGGGNDLQFPHHENEIAQSCCAHPEGDFAKVWMHNEMLQVEGKKMSKSLGNFFTVRDLLDQGVPGEVIRFVFLGTHYSKPMDWTQQKEREARGELDDWISFFSLRPDLFDVPLSSGAAEETIVAALLDDLNTSLALTRLKRMFRKLNSLEYLDLSEAKQRDLDQEFLTSCSFLGFDIVRLAGEKRAKLPNRDLEHFELRLIQARFLALESKDFSEVDRLKAGLLAAGVEVRMSKAGVELLAGPDFDAEALEALE